MSSKKTIRRLERKLAIGTKVAAGKSFITTVDPKTFLESPEYMDAKDVLYPEVLKAFVELNSGTYSEAILTGGIGSLDKKMRVVILENRPRPKVCYSSVGNRAAASRDP